MYDIFISYAGPDKEKAVELYNSFKELDPHCEVFLDQSSLRLGDRWVEEIPGSLYASKFIVILLSENTGKSHYQKEEIIRAINLLRENRRIWRRVIPIYITEPNAVQNIPLGLGSLVGAVVSEKHTFKDIAKKILELLQISRVGEHTSARLGQGIGDRSTVFTEPDKLPELRVFAAELLDQPIILERLDNRIHITINRCGVQNAVYTTPGKNWLCQTYLRDEIREWAQDEDRKIHQFLIGQGGHHSLPLHHFPMRWVSGGVLSIIRMKNKQGQYEDWTPFFFRDISPIGWNIALGSSENEDELHDPSRFYMREFLEETLVLDGDPSSHNVKVKSFVVLPDPERTFLPAKISAAAFSMNHIQLRNRTDSLALRVGNSAIECDHVATNIVINVISDNDPAQEWKHVLICFNVMELGIEIIKVLKYELESTDYLLDGEILERQDRGTGKRWKELVRMPVALISHKYLRKNFGNADFQLNYVYPEIIALEPVVNPSHMPKEAPDTDEIIIFSWDAERRRLIAFSDVNSLDLHESDRHAGERHRNWIQNFSRYFFDSEGNPSNSGPVPWFTPASAKIVSYYFASIAANRVTA